MNVLATFCAGVEFPFVPETGDVPLVCDISSNFLTRKVDVRKVRRTPSDSHSGQLLHLCTIFVCSLDCFMLEYRRMLAALA